MKVQVEEKLRLADSILQRKNLTVDQKESLALEPLKEALRLVFSRPDKGHVVSKLFPLIKRKLDSIHSLNIALNSITTEAIVGLKKTSLSKKYRATYLFMLENIMSELRPKIKNPDTQKFFRSIENANIKLSKDVISYRRFYGMYRSVSPSKIAHKLLEPYQSK